MLLHCHGPWLPAKISLAGKYRPVHTALLQHVLGYKMLAMAVVETGSPQPRSSAALAASSRRPLLCFSSPSEAEHRRTR
jgi:hypothetical protein